MAQSPVPLPMKQAMVHVPKCNLQVAFVVYASSRKHPVKPCCVVNGLGLQVPGKRGATAATTRNRAAKLPCSVPPAHVVFSVMLCPPSCCRFQEEEDASDYVTQLSTDLHMYPPQHVLVGPYLHQHFDPELVGRREGGATTLGGSVLS